jgi:hypothetical protein
MINFLLNDFTDFQNGANICIRDHVKGQGQHGALTPESVF